MCAHAELLQRDLIQHFAAVRAFIVALKASGAISDIFVAESFLTSDSEFSDSGVHAPDYERAFFNIRTLAQLLLRLQPLQHRQ